MPYSKAHQVEIVIGSKSDEPKLEEAGVFEIIKGAGLTWGLSVCSAHRNDHDLTNLCTQFMHQAKTTRAIIAVAGKAAALPGAIAAKMQGPNAPFVLAVALSTGDFYDDQAAVLATLCLPDGCNVFGCGRDKAGLKTAAMMACKLLGESNRDVAARLWNSLSGQRKQAEIHYRTSETEMEKEKKL